MKNSKTYEITTISIFTALIILMATVPWLGYITIGPVSLTIIHIPVLIAGMFGGRKVAVSLGLVFGLSSLAIAYLRPTTPIDLLFQNPLISVLPRIIFGLALYEIYRFFSKLINEEITAISISMVVSTIVHTTLVLVPLYLFGATTIENIFGDIALMPFIWAIFVSNGFLEALAAALIGTPILKALYTARNL
ncbi:MAG: ECF transporter S component [Candidatus Izimaplasma sp.]|nr:ECF transporter S component [Candidatus Izimaplasma bacterium]